VRVSIGADAGTVATAHVRRRPRTTLGARRTIPRNLCRFRTTVPHVRHWAGSSPHRKNVRKKRAGTVPPALPRRASVWCMRGRNPSKRPPVVVPLVRDFAVETPCDSQRSGRAAKGFRPRTLRRARHSKPCIILVLAQRSREKLFGPFAQPNACTVLLFQKVAIFFCHRNRNRTQPRWRCWIPACAGMTVVCRGFSRRPMFWTPACAGMTVRWTAE